jgi:hypothetical protein
MGRPTCTCGICRNCSRRERRRLGYIPKQPSASNVPARRAAGAHALLAAIALQARHDAPKDYKARLWCEIAGVPMQEVV